MATGSAAVRVRGVLHTGSTGLGRVQEDHADIWRTCKQGSPRHHVVSIIREETHELSKRERESERENKLGLCYSIDADVNM